MIAIVVVVVVVVVVVAAALHYPLRGDYPLIVGIASAPFPPPAGRGGLRPCLVLYCYT